MKHLISHYTRWKALAAVFLLLLAAQVLVLMPQATAGSLKYTIVRFDRLKQSTGGAGDVFTSGTVCAKPQTTATETSVKVTFPAGFTVSSTVGNWTVNGTSNASWPKDPADNTTAATAWPTISAPTGSGEFVISGQSVTFGSGDLTANTWYCFNWTNTTAALKTPASPANDLTGSVTTQTTGGAASDLGNYATSIVANDQVAVSASVNPSFTFTLSSNAASLGALSTSSPTESSAISGSVTTNAPQGWQMWAADASGNGGLRSSTAGKTLSYTPGAGGAVVTLTNAAEGYNVGAGTASGTTCTSVTTDPLFASGGTQYRGGGLDGTLRSLAVSTGVANACALPLKVNASIIGSTPAANDYSDVFTVIAAGRF
jgi:hypothetical protein